MKVSVLQSKDVLMYCIFDVDGKGYRSTSRLAETAPTKSNQRIVERSGYAGGGELLDRQCGIVELLYVPSRAEI